MPTAATCPRCPAGPHKVVLVAKVARGTLLFGGPGKPLASAMATATVRCPTTGKPFEVTVEVPVDVGERVDSVSVVAPEAAAAAPVAEVAAAPVSVDTPMDWRPDELAEWRKGSANQGRDAAAKLLAAGTAAVAAYFAILKVVAHDPIAGAERTLAIAPAVGYLLATVLAAVALRPVLIRVFDPDDFERFREDRLKRLSALITGSVSVFVLSTVLAVIAYAVLLP